MLLIALGLAVIVALVSAQIYRRIAAGLRAKGKQRLQAPVLLYTLVISVMLVMRHADPAEQSLVSAARPGGVPGSGAVLPFRHGPGLEPVRHTHSATGG